MNGAESLVRTLVAGGVGTLAVFGVGLLLARSLAPRTAGGKPPAPPS